MFHPHQQKIFQYMIKEDALSHVFLFTGPEGVGKFDFAMQIAGQLLDFDKNLDHPDLKIYNGLTMDSARELKKKLALTPFSAKYKIIIINNAQNINHEAANAILKTLEEPRGDTILFLITTNDKLLPNTIRSRCYKMQFEYVPDKLIESAINTKPIKDLRPHWNGRPSEAKKLLDNSEYLKQVQQYKKDCEVFVQGGLGERFKITENYAKIKDVEKLKDILRIWMEQLEGEINGQEQAKAVKHLLNIYKTLHTTNANFSYLMRNFAIASLHTKVRIPTNLRI